MDGIDATTAQRLANNARRYGVKESASPKPNLQCCFELIKQAAGQGKKYCECPGLNATERQSLEKRGFEVFNSSRIELCPWSDDDTKFCDFRRDAVLWDGRNDAESYGIFGVHPNITFTPISAQTSGKP